MQINKYLHLNFRCCPFLLMFSYQKAFVKKIKVFVLLQNDSKRCPANPKWLSKMSSNRQLEPYFILLQEHPFISLFPLSFFIMAPSLGGKVIASQANPLSGLTGLDPAMWKAGCLQGEPPPPSPGPNTCSVGDGYACCASLLLQRGVPEGVELTG